VQSPAVQHAHSLLRCSLASIIRADTTKSSSSTAASSNTTRSKKARAQTELLQRFNRHGMLVLDSNLTRNTNPQPMETTEQKLQASYHSSLAHSLELVDLEREVAPVYNQLAIGRGFFQSLGSRKSTVGASADTLERYDVALASFRRELASLPSIDAPTVAKHSVQHIPPSDEARNILLELTATARGMNKAAIAAKQIREEEGNQQLIVFSTGSEQGQ
jgi:hypothetical protein